MGSEEGHHHDGEVERHMDKAKLSEVKKKIILDWISNLKDSSKS